MYEIHTLPRIKTHARGRNMNDARAALPTWFISGADPGSNPGADPTNSTVESYSNVYFQCYLQGNNWFGLRPQDYHALGGEIFSFASFASFSLRNITIWSKHY